LKHRNFGAQPEVTDPTPKGRKDINIIILQEKINNKYTQT
jgi:hypothetical protein